MFRSFLMLKSKERTKMVATERWNRWLLNKCNNFTTWKIFNVCYILFSSWCIANFLLKYSPQIHPFHRSYLNIDEWLSKTKSEGQRGKKFYCLLFFVSFLPSILKVNSTILNPDGTCLSFAWGNEASCCPPRPNLYSMCLFNFEVIYLVS